MATAIKKATTKEYDFTWEGRNREGKTARGEMRAASENSTSGRFGSEKCTLMPVTDNTMIARALLQCHNRIHGRSI